MTKLKLGHKCVVFVGYEPRLENIHAGTIVQIVERKHIVRTTDGTRYEVDDYWMTPTDFATRMQDARLMESNSLTKPTHPHRSSSVAFTAEAAQRWLANASFNWGKLDDSYTDHVEGLFGTNPQ